RFPQKQLAIGDICAVPYLLGKQPAAIGRGFDRLLQFLRDSRISSRQFVVCAFSRQQGPGAANAGSIKRRTVGMLSVSIVVVAVPARTLRNSHLQQCIEDFNRVQNPGIVWCAQSESHQGQRVWTDNVGSLLPALADRTVLDGDKSICGRCRAVAQRWRNPHVIAGDTDLARKIAVGRIRPAFDVLVPKIRELTQILALSAWPTASATSAAASNPATSTASVNGE